MERSHRSGPSQESDHSLAAKIQPRPFGEPQVEPPSPTFHDFSHVDLFSHAPQRAPIQMKLSVGTTSDRDRQEVEQVAAQDMSMPESAIEQSVQRKPAAQEDTLQRNSGVQQGQLHVLQTKDNVIQPWLDENGKFYPGAQPPNADTDWESFDHGTGKNWQKRWRPKAGSAAAKQAEAVKAAQEDKQQAAKKKAAAKNAEWQKQSRKKDYDSIFLEDPARIRFSQDSISALFSNNQPIQGLVDGLKNGTVQADAIPPLMVWYDEKNKLLFTLDNRRLWAFQKAKKQVRCRFASPEEMKSNQFKFTTKNNGKSIAVRG